MKSFLLRFISFAISACLLLGIAPVSGAAAAGNYQSDITGHWAQEVLSTWIDLGYLKGDGSGRYYPDQDITRAEFFSFVNRIMNFTERSANILRCSSG
jgi:hypothetical protein